jgi:hypothetical protein
MLQHAGHQKPDALSGGDLYISSTNFVLGTTLSTQAPAIQHESVRDPGFPVPFKLPEEAIEIKSKCKHCRISEMDTPLLTERHRIWMRVKRTHHQRAPSGTLINRPAGQARRRPNRPIRRCSTRRPPREPWPGRWTSPGRAMVGQSTPDRARVSCLHIPCPGDPLCVQRMAWGAQARTTHLSQGSPG